MRKKRRIGSQFRHCYGTGQRNCRCWFCRPTDHPYACCFGRSGRFDGGRELSGTCRRRRGHQQQRWKPVGRRGGGGREGLGSQASSFWPSVCCSSYLAGDEEVVDAIVVAGAH
ncbi:unnamed protein product [Musa acuminata var. zebrina]